MALINVENILNVTPATFNTLALQVFNYQYENNRLYHDYCNALYIDKAKINDVNQIPFLPVSFFKTHKIVAGSIPDNALAFESSGTTGETPSRHYIADPGLYEASLLQGFQQYYGNPAGYAILALLPSYLERQNASLVYMAKTLMAKSTHPDNGFYIDEWEKLHNTIVRLEANGQKTLLLGVTFALLDFAAAFPMPLTCTIVMETGGMKGRRRELTRAEVHEILKGQFGLTHIHSEYGMTELLSQAYAAANGVFLPTATMRVMIRDINDPLDVCAAGSGCINIIDLANLHSCAFIATEDIGNINDDGSFEVLGRMDNSALRGCSLMSA